MGSENDRYRIAPGAIPDPSSPTYLGNPDVVARLVGGFIAKVEAITARLDAGEMTAKAGRSELAGAITAMADVFSGRDANWTIIRGYHDFTLGVKLKADLARHWAKVRAQFGDDPVAVLFDWLAALTIEKVRLADGDDMLLEVALKPSVQYAVKVLLGIEERAPA